MINRFTAWIYQQRSSARLALVFQIFVRILFSVFSLIWTPLLLHSMGNALNGVFLNFQKITSLGGIGDLGMGGAVNIRTSRLLGQRKECELKRFLGAARGIFFVMAILAACIFWIISPKLFAALKFASVPETGVWPLLSLVGGVAIGFVVLNSYTTNLNYGCANLVLPIFPTFLIMQLAFLGHWLLAKGGAVFWVQYLPYLASAVLIHVTGWLFLKVSHPALATFRPSAFNRRQFAELFGDSFWYYLATVGAGIWVTTDMFLITAQFGTEIIPAYQYNSRLCELAAFVINSANLAAMSKIAQWIVSPESTVRNRAVEEVMRLGKFQTLLGCSAALVYLNVNDWFMKSWLGSGYEVPFSWQVAFAASVAVAGGGQMVGNLTPRCCENGLRLGGIVTLTAAILNFGLSFVSIRLSSVVGMNISIFGIALATVIAQSSRDLVLGNYISQQLNISWWRLNLKNWLLGLVTISLAAATISLRKRGFLNLVLPWVIQASTLLIVARLTGITLEDLKKERQIFGAMMRR